MKQSIVLPLFWRKEIPLALFLDRAKAMGYEAVEIWSRDDDFDQLAETVIAKEMKLVSMVGHEHACDRRGSHAAGFSEMKNHNRLVDELSESIDLAVKYQIPGLITLSGHRNAGQSDSEAMQVCAEGLAKIAPYAEEKGVNLNMELLNTNDHPNYLCDNTSWAIDLCEMLNSPRCKILYDIYHMQIMEGNVIENIKRSAPWTGHYHTAGVPGRRDLDNHQELNYRGICDAIRDTGYELYLGHEYSPKADPFDSLKEAFLICQ